MKVGFLGLGIMGTPMALNLVRGGHEVVVWSRTPSKCVPLRDAGATVADSVASVFEDARVVITMLSTGDAIDEVLMRGTPRFASMLRDRTLVQMGTTSPEYSKALGEDVCAAGGRYVEAPVSGSRKPAEAGSLVGMLAGDAEAIDDLGSLFEPMCARTFYCGPVPNALLMKLSVNLFLITMVAGLAEAFHFAAAHELDRSLLASILDAGPMASDVSRMKTAKLVSGDDSVQASIADVATNGRLIENAADAAGVATPLLREASRLFTRAEHLGLGGRDMIEVLGS
jgi:3-hydroxyisobutyrate dehydrogenase